jgi:hypothetical protein
MPSETAFFSKPIHREIAFRLLQYPQGDFLRAMARLDDERPRLAEGKLYEAVSSRPACVHCAYGRFHSEPSLPCGDCAQSIAISKASRLLGARERMLVEGLDATRAALEVGYESIIAAGLSLVALYGILATIKRRRALKRIAERVCNVSVIRPPRWNNRPVKEYVLRGPALNALTAEHNLIARQAESELIRLGLRPKGNSQGNRDRSLRTPHAQVRSALQFALRKLSNDHQNIYRIGDVKRLGRNNEAIRQAHVTGR